MLFQTLGDKRAPAVLFFHAMGVTGASSERVAQQLCDGYYCIMPTSTVYCEGQKNQCKDARKVREGRHKDTRKSV